MALEKEIEFPLDLKEMVSSAEISVFSRLVSTHLSSSAPDILSSCKAEVAFIV